MKRKMPEIKTLPIQVRDVDIGFPALVVTNSNSLRITIPVRAVQMYDIRAGDQVQVKVIRVSRTQQETFEDQQKAESKKWEKQERRSTLKS